MKDLEDALGELRATNVIFSPSSTTMEELLNFHGKYGISHIISWICRAVMKFIIFMKFD